MAARLEGVINNVDSGHPFKPVNAQQHGAFSIKKRMVGGLCLASPDECFNIFSGQFLMAGICFNVEVLDLRQMPRSQFNKNDKKDP